MKQNTPPLVLRSEMRTDSVPVDEHYSAEGYFYDNPILTRTGIFKYTLEDGSERRELRRPEDVFDPESLASYEGKPIIITHDARVIDKDNARRERVGTILTPGQQDGETVRARIVIDDPDAVKAYEELHLLSERSMASRTFYSEAPKMKGRDRNKPCPCGSGRKFKNCCGIS